MPEKFHDFRTSSWYIDAATSSKDIVILLDSSSSMGGKKREIARAIVNSILDTLGNNDFVNIYRFTEATNEIVPCFKDILVQVGTLTSKQLAFSNLQTKNQRLNFKDDFIISNKHFFRKYQKELPMRWNINFEQFLMYAHLFLCGISFDPVNFTLQFNFNLKCNKVIFLDIFF